MPAPEVDLVVLGGGAAGLTAAWRAAATGRSVVLVERSPALGGLAASFEVAGQRVDHGSHRLHPATDPALLADLRDLLGDDLQTRPRHGRLRLYDQWVGFPLRTGELARTVPRRALVRIARDALCEPFRRAGWDDYQDRGSRPRAAVLTTDGGRPIPPRRPEEAGRRSYARRLSVSLGPELYGELYAPYAEKLWGLPGSAIDEEQARRRVSADSPWKIAAKLLRRSQPQGRIFYYPRRGFGQIPEALAAAATAAGAELRTGTEVTALELRGRTPTVRLADGTGITAGHVLSTVPLPVLARLARPQPAADVLGAASGLALRGMVLAYLVHRPSDPDRADSTWPSTPCEAGRPAAHGDRGGGAPPDTARPVPDPDRGRGSADRPPPGMLRRWTEYDAHYFPGPETPVTRISEPANYRDSTDDPAGHTVLCAEIPCAVGDRWWAADDAELAAAVTRTLAEHGLPPVSLAGVHVRRLPHVYPVYTLGFGERLRPVQAWADTLPRVTTLGRQGLFVHDNTHHTMAMAYAAVDALRPDGTRDERAWHAALDRFAHHVVED